MGTNTHIIKRLYRVDDESFINQCQEQTAAFYKFWKDKVQGDGLIPARSDFLPEEMISFLPNLCLIERDESNELRYRLVGSHERSLRPNDPTGELVRTHFMGEDSEDAINNYETVLRSGKLLFDKDEYVDQKGIIRRDETLFLPLAQDYIHPNMVIIHTVITSVLSQ